MGQFTIDDDVVPSFGYAITPEPEDAERAARSWYDLTANDFLDVAPAAMSGIGQTLSLAESTIAGGVDSLFGTDYEDYWLGNAADFSEQVQGYNARERSMLGSFAYGFGKVLAETATTPAGLFATEMTQRTAQEIEQGVDINTASVIGGVQGITTTADVLLPATFGKTALQKIGIGGGVGAGFGIAQPAAEKGAFLIGGYDERAAQIDPLDPTNIAVNAAMGGLFGAGAAGLAWMRLRREREMTGSERDKLDAATGAAYIEDTAPFELRTQSDLDNHLSAFEEFASAFNDGRAPDMTIMNRAAGTPNEARELLELQTRADWLDAIGEQFDTPEAFDFYRRQSGMEYPLPNGFTPTGLRRALDQLFGADTIDPLVRSGQLEIVPHAGKLPDGARDTFMRSAAPDRSGAYVSWDTMSDPVFDKEGDEVGTDDYALIEKVYVPPEKRGQGIARQMLRETLAEIQAKHPSLPIKLAAKPTDDMRVQNIDADSLVKFYESEGFDVVDTAGDAVVMEFDGRIRGEKKPLYSKAGAYTKEALDYLVDSGVVSRKEADDIWRKQNAPDRKGAAGDGERDTGAARPAGAAEGLTHSIDGRQLDEGWQSATAARTSRGEAIPVFRGSRSGQVTPETFDPERAGKGSSYPTSGLGVFFSTWRGDAAKYGPSVGEFRLDIRKPKVYRGATLDKLAAMDSLADYRQFRDELIKQGYDGVVMDYRDVGGPVHFVAFHPHQVINAPERELMASAEGQRIKAVTDPATGKVYMVADQLTPDDLKGVALHEFLHVDANKAFDSPDMFDALAKMETSKNKAERDAYAMAKARAMSAGTPERHMPHEIAGYLVEAYANRKDAPAGIKAVIDDLLTRIKAYLRSAGLYKGELSRAELALIAERSLKTAAQQAKANARTIPQDVTVSDGLVPVREHVSAAEVAAKTEPIMQALESEKTGFSTIDDHIKAAIKEAREMVKTAAAKADAIADKMGCLLKGA